MNNLMFHLDGTVIRVSLEPDTIKVELIDGEEAHCLEIPNPLLELRRCIIEEMVFARQVKQPVPVTRQRIAGLIFTRLVRGMVG